MFGFIEWYANIFNKKPRGQVVPSLVSRESSWTLGREGFSLSETLINICWLIWQADHNLPIWGHG